MSAMQRVINDTAPQYQMLTQTTQPLPRYSQYTMRLMTPLVWRTLASTTQALWPTFGNHRIYQLQPAETESAPWMWYDCSRPKSKVRRKCPFIHIRRRNQNRSRNSVDLYHKPHYTLRYQSHGFTFTYHEASQTTDTQGFTYHKHMALVAWTLPFTYTSNNVHCAVIMAKPLWEFTRFIWMNAH